MSEPPPSEDLDFVKPSRKERPKRVEYYAEETFAGANLTRYVHIGWGVVLGAAAIFGCMAISAITQPRSWNVSFLWLQRRVGFQFGTLSYLVTTSALYYHDGDKWCTRNWAQLMNKFGGKGKASAQALPSTSTKDDISRGFAATALSAHS